VVHTTTIELRASNGYENSYYGFSVSLFGDTAVVGAPFANNYFGVVYVYTRSGDVWNEVAQLSASDNEPFSSFGYSTALSGNYLLVGAPFKDEPSIDDAGAAYLFINDNGNWIFTQKVSASDPAGYDNFGYSVALSGGTAVVGAYQKDLGSSVIQGAAYVFTESAGSWSEQQKLLASDGGEYDYFGRSVAISGDTLVVGAPGRESQRGAAYVFTRSADTWSEQQKLTAEDRTVYAEFGISVDIDGDSIVVGASSAMTEKIYRGAAYIFSRSATTWNQNYKLVSDDGGSDDYFGFKVDISGDNVLIGAPLADSYKGKAYSFSLSTGVQKEKFTDLSGSTSDSFGLAVAAFGDTFLIAAPFKALGTIPRYGAVKVFQTKTSVQKVIGSDIQPDDRFGHSTAIFGDTAVIGAPLHNNGTGAVYVFSRSGRNWNQLAKLTSPEGTPSAQFGQSVSIFGNTLVVGASLGSTDSLLNTGTAYVFLNDGTNWSFQTKLSAPDASVGARFGFSVSAFDDTIAVGSPEVSIGSNLLQGATYIFNRSSGSWAFQQKLIAPDGNSEGRLGWRVSLFRDSIAIGAPGDASSRGAVYVFNRSNSSWTFDQKLTDITGQSGDYFGWGVSMYEDSVAVGSPGEINPSSIGAVVVFKRNNGTWATQSKILSSERQPLDYFGEQVSIFRDTLIVGAHGFDDPETGRNGISFVYNRGGSSWYRQRRMLSTDGSSGGFGWSVSISGNAAIVGAPFPSSVQSNNLYAPSGTISQGGASIYYWGSGTPTAGGSRISGRVLDSTGRGLSNASVILNDTNGKTFLVQTGTFGKFAFENLPSGESFVLSVRSKRYLFSPTIINLSDDLTDLTIRP